MGFFCFFKKNLKKPNGKAKNVSGQTAQRKNVSGQKVGHNVFRFKGVNNVFCLCLRFPQRNPWENLKTSLDQGRTPRPTPRAPRSTPTAFSSCRWALRPTPTTEETYAVFRFFFFKTRRNLWEKLKTSLKQARALRSTPGAPRSSPTAPRSARGAPRSNTEKTHGVFKFFQKTKETYRKS